MQLIFGYLSLALSIGANVPYVIEIIQGKVRPERISWLIWTLLGTVYFVTALREDGATLFTFGELIGPIVILVLSLKYGVGGRSRFDNVSFGIALVAIILLVLSKDPLLSLFLALFADSIGSILTIRKLHKDPTSESRWFWAVAGISGLFAIASLTTFTIETLAFPLYVVLLSAYIALRARPARSHNDAVLEKL